MADAGGLVAFLEKCLAEDEAAAKAATQGSWEVSELDGELSIRADQSADHRPRTEFRHVSEHVYDRTDADHIARWDPPRVLAEIAAKRRLLGLHMGSYAELDDGTRHYFCQDRGADPDFNGDLWAPCLTARLLVAPYAGRPGWRDEWAL